jgi:hypothetical protein
MSTLGDAADVKFGNFDKFQYTKRFLIPCHAMFSRDCPLAVKPASTPRRLVQKNGGILYLLICSFCCVYLGCCAAVFGSSGETYELPCIKLS